MYIVQLYKEDWTILHMLGCQAIGLPSAKQIVIIVHLTQTNVNENLKTIMIKSMRLLNKHIHLKAHQQILKIVKNSDSSDSILSSPLVSEWLSQADEIIEVKLNNAKICHKFPSYN